ncbi:MAG: transcriptional repressor LexA [Planctomycetes bacterium]|nr:transcriptional repressor LexA [Planctomycetota bacterium]
MQQEQITPRQLKVLSQVSELERNNCYLPTIAEVAGELGVSRTTVFEHIGALRKKGLIAKTTGKARSLKITSSANRLLESVRQQNPVYNRPASRELEGLPLLGKVAAGVPIEAIENAERVSLKDMFGDSDDVFALAVTGDSMIEEGIDTGDVVICKKATNASNGQIVVAIVDDDSATLKRFYRENDHVRLEASNDAYDDIVTQNCRIEGVVLGHLRQI